MTDTSVPALTLPEPNQVEYNALGYDEHGFNRDGFDVRGLNAEGFDAEGFDALGHNINGYTFAQQAAYEDFYTVNAEYNPEQTILEDDRYWGTLRDSNNYLTSVNTVTTGPLYLGDFNLKWNEYNDKS